MQKELEIHYTYQENQEYDDALNELLAAYGIEEDINELVKQEKGEHAK